VRSGRSSDADISSISASATGRITPVSLFGINGNRASRRGGNRCPEAVRTQAAAKRPSTLVPSSSARRTRRRRMPLFRKWSSSENGPEPESRRRFGFPASPLSAPQRSSIFMRCCETGFTGPTTLPGRQTLAFPRVQNSNTLRAEAKPGGKAEALTPRGRCSEKSHACAHHPSDRPATLLFSSVHKWLRKCTRTKRANLRNHRAGPRRSYPRGPGPVGLFRGRNDHHAARAKRTARQPAADRTPPPDRAAGVEARRKPVSPPLRRLILL